MMRIRLAGLLYFCFYAFLLTAQVNVQFRSQLSFVPTLSNIWGYADTLTGAEYALVGHEFGLSIVDVTNPDAPQLLFDIPGDTSFWREPKTWSHYAYVTNEQGGGLLIVNLQNLPWSVNTFYWTGGGQLDYKTSHTPFIDEKGILYLNGSKGINGNAGTLMFDLKPDPFNPQYLGTAAEAYVHDCYVRGDTLWAAEIYTGSFTVWDVSDKASPQLLAQQLTPLTFTHNTWLTDNGRYLFTTDERAYASVACYEVSDLQNITLLDEYRSSPLDSLIPHNTYVLPNGYIYTSYYRHGVTIADVHRPHNIVETAWYDTSPFPGGPGFEGCWGVYPFLPSGNILCSDREEGLFVLTPQLVRACYLEGIVTANGIPQPGVQVELIGANRYDQSRLTGNYATGAADSGLYDVRFYFPSACFTKIVPNVLLQPGLVTQLNVDMECTPLTVPSPRDENSFHFYFSKGSLWVSNLEETTRADVRITDSNGRSVFSQTGDFGNTQIDLKHLLLPGFYVAEISGKGMQKRIRFSFSE